jgi:hypothetical protein
MADFGFDPRMGRFRPPLRLANPKAPLARCTEGGGLVPNDWQASRGSIEWLQ